MPNPNYIQEINRFYDWLETNQIPKSAIALWHGLMHIANKAGWEQQFTVAISTIESKTGFKRSELFEARNILTQKGRINWKQRGGNLCAEYEILFFCVHNTDTSTDAKADTSADAKANTKPTQKPTITKLKQTKRENSKSHSTPNGVVEEKITIPYWKNLVDTWFLFFGEKFKHPENQQPVKPLFKAAQAKQLKEIVIHLEKICLGASGKWTEPNAVHYLRGFLEKAWMDKWLREHFELKNLLSNINSITNKNPSDAKNNTAAAKSAIANGYRGSSGAMQIAKKLAEEAGFTQS